MTVGCLSRESRAPNGSPADYHATYFSVSWNINGDRVIGYDHGYISDGDPGIFGDDSSPDPATASGECNTGSRNY